MNIFQNILVVDNYDSFTFNLVDFIEQEGCDVTVCKNDVSVVTIEEITPDLIVFSPGPSTPSNAGNMMKMIEKYFQHYPMFGVCLGHEALIEFFGGSLKLTEPVHGKYSPIHHDGKTIFTGLDQNFLAGRYHSLVADEVPECLEVSATVDGLVMAVRHKELAIEGVQFHPESVLSMEGDNGINLMRNVIHKYFANV